MTRAPKKTDPRLPPRIAEHLEYQVPQEFSGVDWRDIAALSERVARLEQRNSSAAENSANRSQWAIPIIVAIVTVVLTLGGQAAWESIKDKRPVETERTTQP